MTELQSFDFLFTSQDNINSIDARKLHAALGIGRDFSTWIKGRLEGFEKGNDFMVHKTGEQQNQVLKIDYILTLDVAKEIALMERNEQGRAIRKYLIECEKKLRNPVPVIMTPERTAVDIAECMLRLGDLFGTPKHIVAIEAAKRIELRVGMNVQPLLLASPVMNDIKPNEVMLEPTELARKLGFKSAIALNKYLSENGYQHREQGSWMPTEKGKPFCSLHAWSKDSKSGYNLKWNLKAIKDTMQE